jgi:hypothetical protein
MKFRERKKGRRKKNKEAQLMTKTKERSQAKQSTNSTLKTARRLPLNKCKLPPEHVDANFQILAHLF